MRKELSRIVPASILIFFHIVIVFIYLTKVPNALILLIPCTYVLLFLVLLKIHHYYKFPGLFVLNIVFFLRYSILPIIYFWKYQGYVMAEMTSSIVIIWISMFVYFIILLFFKKKYDKIVFVSEMNKNRKYYLIVLIVIIAFLFIIINPHIIKQYNFVFSNKDSLILIKGREISQGLVSIIVDYGKLFFPAWIAHNLYKKERYSKKYTFLVIVLILIGFNTLIFSGTSRNSMFVPSIASIFYLVKLYPKNSKKIFIQYSILLIVAISSLSMLKINYTTNSFDTKESVEYVDYYFHGPKNITNGMETAKKFKQEITMSTFMTDVLGNMPVISKKMNLSNRTSYYFNLNFYNGRANQDKIIPSGIQGMIYFGPLFFWFPFLFSLLLGYVFDKFYFESKYTLESYIYAFFSAKIYFSIFNSFSILFSFLYSYVIPILGLIYIDRLLNNTELRRSYDRI